MQNQLGLRTLEQRRADARVIMLFEIIHGLVAIPMSPYFEQPSRMTRHSQPLALHQIHTTANYYNRPIYRAPLGHTRFYCQGALFPWPDKTCNQFPIQFFTISRRNNCKSFCCYINHTSGDVLTMKQTMNRPLIPDSYRFLLPNTILCSKISLHKRTLRMCGIPDEVAREAY